MKKDYRKKILAQIIKLHLKLRKKNKLYKEDSNGMNAVGIYFNQNKIVKILSNCLNNKSYQIENPLERDILIGKKMRHICSYTHLDNIIQSTIYEIILEKSSNLISPHVYSYIKGRSGDQAVSNFITYLKKLHKPTSHLDLYIFRGDITGYTDNIPIHNSSLVWKYIGDVLQELSYTNNEEKKYYLQLIEKALRPCLKTNEGINYQKLIGIPTGSPMSTLVANFYLQKLDNTLANIPGAFYARYGDDFLFAHPNIRVFLEAEIEITHILKTLGLKCNSKKNQRFYFTKAGKKFVQTEDVPHSFTGCHQINYLGYLINADGSTSPTNSSIKKFIKFVRNRIKNFDKLFSQYAEETRVKLICQAVNQLLDPKHPFSYKNVSILLMKTTNHGCLKDLDYIIALTISECLTKVKGTKAWRSIPYKILREKGGLISLCNLKVNSYNRKKTLEKANKQDYEKNQN